MYIYIYITINTCISGPAADRDARGPNCDEHACIICVYIYIYIYIYTYIHTYIYIYIYRERERKRERYLSGICAKHVNRQNPADRRCGSSNSSSHSSISSSSSSSR